MFNKTVVSFNYGDHACQFEHGVWARQAHSVLLKMGETTVLAAVTMATNKNPAGFLPLTVNYCERSYAMGKVPGGYFKREGRPTERETLTSRLIDRSLRPLFPKSFCDEINVVITVLSLDPKVGAAVPAMLAASAALHISGLPFDGPIGCTAVGHVDGALVYNPSPSDLDEGRLHLMVAGTKDAIVMVESSAQELPEATMAEAILEGHKFMQEAISNIESLREKVTVEPWQWQPVQGLSHEDTDRVHAWAQEQVVQAYQEHDKKKRKEALASLREACVTAFCGDAEAGVSPSEVEAPLDQALVLGALSDCERNHVRGQVVNAKARLDGRALNEVRPISIETGAEAGFAPRVHGSALFTRGETQAFVSTTFGSSRDVFIVDGLDGRDQKSHFNLHYNFPPYCVGEVGFMSGPKRREIGHGNLARRALEAVIPTQEAFPYVLRLVSEVTESNGSSSMASVCGGSLSLMDAGVPIKAPVAGVAMGLIKEGEQFAVLTDILGDEDHLGDMDFKVAGTEEGVTALQMDIKITGITKEIMEQALSQAKEGRMHILGLMKDALATPRKEMCAYAPRLEVIKINPDKIKDVIGKGGVVIREIIDTYGVEMDISDNGDVKIQSPSGESLEAAKEHVKRLTQDVEMDQVYDGKIVKIMEFGAFVSLLPGKDGFLHISQISHERVENIHDWLSEGQEVTVKVVEFDKQGRPRVSLKALQSRVNG